MVPLQRIVHLTMDRKMYKKLGNELEIGKAWKMVKEIIGDHLFQTNFVPVPQIDSAVYYNQLFIFEKQTNLSSFLRISPPRYRITSNLDTLLNIELSASLPQFDFSPWNFDDASELPHNFHFVLESSEEEFLPKSIEINIKQPRIRNANPPILGSTFLNLPSRRAHNRYIITSVVLANYVDIIVTIGQDRSIFVCGHVIPIGFQYKKYKILANGQVHQELPTSLKLTDKEGVWLRPAHRSLFREPLWDPMRRRHDGSRPNRSVTTLCANTPRLLSLSHRHGPMFIRLPDVESNNSDLNNNTPNEEHGNGQLQNFPRIRRPD